MCNNGSWNGTANGNGYGGTNGSYSGTNGSQQPGFPYNASGWEWSGDVSSSKGGWTTSDGWGTGANKGGPNAWDNGIWSNGWGATGNWGETGWGTGAPAGKGRAGRGAEREEEFDDSHSQLNRARLQQDHRVDGHRQVDAEDHQRQQASFRTERLRLDNDSNDGDSDNGDPLPPPASEAEVEEARAIVEKAQRQAAERDKMKKAAVGCSKDDLQAMINRRLAQK